MKGFFVFVAIWSFAWRAFGGEAERTHLEDVVLPKASEFIGRNKLALALPLVTNQVSHFSVEFGQGNGATTAHLRLTNRLNFHLQTSQTNTEVRSFYDAKVKTYYDLTAAPPDKIEAVRALNNRNKLNDKTAQALLTSFFLSQGHQEQNFHSMEFSQLSWGKKGDPDFVPLPFYAAEWYRKDVKKQDREVGLINLPSVRIEVSGLDSQIIRYSKTFMPIGRDF